VAQGCAKGHRNAGWLQAGAEPSASGGGGVHGLVIHNVSVLGATPTSAELSWLCSNGTLHGSASAVVPPMAGCVAPKRRLKSDDWGSAMHATMLRDLVRMYVAPTKTTVAIERGCFFF
jgi:hypothetical protein